MERTCISIFTNDLILETTIGLKIYALFFSGYARIVQGTRVIKENADK
jgi:hypothetical protein